MERVVVDQPACCAGQVVQPAFQPLRPLAKEWGGLLRGQAPEVRVRGDHQEGRVIQIGLAHGLVFRACHVNRGAVRADPVGHSPILTLPAQQEADAVFDLSGGD